MNKKITLKGKPDHDEKQHQYIETLNCNWSAW